MARIIISPRHYLSVEITQEIGPYMLVRYTVDSHKIIRDGRSIGYLKYARDDKTHYTIAHLKGWPRRILVNA